MSDGELVLRGCKKCGLQKPATTEFFYQRHTTNLDSYCIPCRRTWHRAYYEDNKDLHSARVAKWRAANLDRAVEISRQWIAAHPDRMLELQSNWKRKKLASDPFFALNCRIRTAIRGSLRGTKRGRSWESLVGYTLEDITKHLERQFHAGMNWGRFRAGEIHIDHIRPIDSFQFECPEDQGFLDCWALTNLRPMWALDNIKKRNKRLFLI